MGFCSVEETASLTVHGRPQLRIADIGAVPDLKAAEVCGAEHDEEGDELPDPELLNKFGVVLVRPVRVVLSV